MGAGIKTGVFDTLVDWLVREKPAAEIPLSNFDRLRHEIRPCDVILVEGRSRVSEVIKVVTQSRWSHAALYIGRLHEVESPYTRKRISEYYDGQPNVQLIVESELGRGTVVRPLSSYDRDHVRICRPRELNYQDAQNVLNYAIRQLGANYNIRQIFDLFRFLLPWTILPRRWRSSLFRSHPGLPTETVCSTMIAEAFNSIQYPILPLVKKTSAQGIQLFRRNPKLCTPSDFDYSPYFDIIKYPFVDFSHSKSRYRLLPWSGNEKLSPEESDFYIDDLPGYQDKLE
ncbi:hypothetical protein EUZ85_20455 [Hahella sp. KA22]|uniref:YiiX/YebB-like N1pC/P60 family cysteine hydrolase n=1 Tax=Hahella sp. KA22 TaxID=1628392 RepID=UPI000FDD695D|nr:YiiX/YebB-like N1pC/P60 family cysteine hydrolase [Hahella sp. KA22]AZZ92972.1 hypothetical protein ENC22_17875 [Hahella sp. KA22]QAY56346.1 hypothetical protein EUZ85_20455 [Hahella sp. KA22]